MIPAALSSQSSQNDTSSCVLSGDAVIEFLGFTESSSEARAIDPWSHVGYLAVYYAALVALTFCLVWWKWPKRRVEVKN